MRIVVKKSVKVRKLLKKISINRQRVVFETTHSLRSIEQNLNKQISKVHNKSKICLND